MQLATGEIQSDHDAMVAYIDSMKGVYQRVINRHQKDGEMTAKSIIQARTHLRMLENMEKLMREHHEMTKGCDYKNGRTRPLNVDLATVATLILPDGSRKEIKRG